MSAMRRPNLRLVTGPTLQDRLPLSVSATKILVAIFAYNEGVRIEATVERVLDAVPYDVLLVDDGSTDGSIDALRQRPITVLSNWRNRGLGAAMKQAFSHALTHGYHLLVSMAGNNQDNPVQIPRLLKPILEDGYDFVQGSRFLPGGHHGKMPRYRLVATRCYARLISHATGKSVTEGTNGFRAFKTGLLRDPRIDWHQAWLDTYELEPYLLYKTLVLGYRHLEVPVTKIYPRQMLGYTQMKAMTNWWYCLRPVFFLFLRIKR